MTRAGRELAIAQSPQLAAQGLLGDRDPELVEHPLHEIDQAPAHDPVNRRDRAVVDHALEFLALDPIQERTRARSPAGHQPLWPAGVEAHNPVPHDLQGHSADPRRLAAGGSLIDRRERHQPPGLIRIPRAPGESTQTRGVKVRAQRDGSGHGDLLLGSPFESLLTRRGKPYVSQPRQDWVLRL